MLFFAPRKKKLLLIFPYNEYDWDDIVIDQKQLVDM